MTSGWCPSTSKRPGTLTAPNASVTTSGASGAAKNASVAVKAIEALSPWWAPCSGTNTSG